MTSKVSFTVRRPSPVSRGSSTGADSDSNSSFKIPAIPRHLSSANSSARASPSPLGRGSPAPKRTREEQDSSDEEEGNQDELVTGFDQFGVQRCVSSPDFSPLHFRPLHHGVISFTFPLNSFAFTSPFLLCQRSYGPQLTVASIRRQTACSART